MINIEDKISSLIEYFKNEKNILAAWIIGSYGTEFQREDSDIDFAILYDEPVNTRGEIFTACDITTILRFENIDIVNLKRAPITLQFKAIRDGRALYEADFIKVSDYIELVINRYQNEKYYIDQFNIDFREGMSIRR